MVYCANIPSGVHRPPGVPTPVFNTVVEAVPFKQLSAQTKSNSSRKRKNLQDTHLYMPSRCCKHECFKQIPENRRLETYAAYWEMDHDHQLMWLEGKVNPCPVTRRRKSTNKENPLRKCSRIYTLPRDVINHVTVCKEYFFIHTWV